MRGLHISNARNEQLFESLELRLLSLKQSPKNISSSNQLLAFSLLLPTDIITWEMVITFLQWSTAVEKRSLFNHCNCLLLPLMMMSGKILTTLFFCSLLKRVLTLVKKRTLMRDSRGWPIGRISTQIAIRVDFFTQYVCTWLLRHLHQSIAEWRKQTKKKSVSTKCQISLVFNSIQYSERMNTPFVGSSALTPSQQTGRHTYVLVMIISICAWLTHM